VSQGPTDDDRWFYEQPLFCSFCNRDQDQARKLVAGRRVIICAECVEDCVEILAAPPGLENGTGAPSVVGSVTSARCSLCRTPTPVEELLAVLGRGALCHACVWAIEGVLRSRARETPSE
jgi:ClpX C4-type zinc finger protein